MMTMVMIFLVTAKIMAVTKENVYVVGEMMERNTAAAAAAISGFFSRCVDVVRA